MEEPLIQQFMVEYDKCVEFYIRLKNHVHNRCTYGLATPRVQHQISSRVKNRTSLQEKLVKRNSETPYQDGQAVKKDIVDIVGVRISLYFPDSAATVENMICSVFLVDDTKQHPLKSRAGRSEQYNYKFPGYTATHYRARLQPTDHIAGYEAEIFEIQVVSALAQVWSEIEHDIVYKVLEMKPTENEERMLDSLNGLVKTGEVILEQIQKLLAARTSHNTEAFENKYEVGAYLSREVQKDSVKIDSVSALHKLLQVLDMATAKDLAPSIRELCFGEPDNSVRQRIQEHFKPFDLSASVYIMQHILSGLSEGQFEQAVQKARRETGSSDDYLYKCTAIMSSLIWLSELFSEPEGDMLSKILEQFKDERSTLDWATGSIEPMMIFLGQLDYPEHQKPAYQKLDRLWNIFENSGEETFQFVFRLSRMGVYRRFPRDISQLQNLGEFIKNLKL